MLVNLRVSRNTLSKKLNRSPPFYYLQLRMKLCVAMFLLFTDHFFFSFIARLLCYCFRMNRKKQRLSDAQNPKKQRMSDAQRTHLVTFMVDHSDLAKHGIDPGPQGAASGL